MIPVFRLLLVDWYIPPTVSVYDLYFSQIPPEAPVEYTKIKNVNPIRWEGIEYSGWCGEKTTFTRKQTKNLTDNFESQVTKIQCRMSSSYRKEFGRHLMVKGPKRSCWQWFYFLGSKLLSYGNMYSPDALATQAKPKVPPVKSRYVNT